MKAITKTKSDYNDKILFFAVSLMFFFFLSFIWVSIQATSAIAEDQNTCRGENLLEHYAANEPEKLAQIKAEAEKTLNGEAILWKVEKDGVEPSWILGTMHMADARIAILEGKKLDAFNASEIVVIESTEALDPASAQKAMASLGHLTFLPVGQDLADFLDEESLALLKPMVESRGVPFAVASKLRPWTVATTIAIPECEMIAKQSGKPVLDSLIAKRALNEGKNLQGLETVEEQLNAIATLPQEFHVTALKETLQLGDVIDDVIETMKQIYLMGNTGMVLPLMKVASPKTSTSSGNQQFQEQLILKRNINMAERSIKFLDKGKTFIAVGALHLPGETGLVNQFREKGFTVTAVK